MTEPWVRFAGGEGARELPGESPFVIGVIADLSARSEGGGSARGAARAIRDVDRDELDALLATTAPRVELALPGEAVVAVQLECFDDFHPDRLVSRIPSTAALLRAREVAHDARELQRRLTAAGIALEEPAPVAVAATGSSPPDSSGRALLEEMLGEPAPSAPPRATTQRGDAAVAALVRAIADASSDGTPVATTAERRAAIDRELTLRIRAALRDPRLRALEASWRGLRDLLRAAEVGEALRVRVLDASRADLIAESSGLEALFRELTLGAPAAMVRVPALIVSDLCFSAGGEDLALLERIGDAARRAGACFVAGAEPALLDAAARGDLARDADWRSMRARCGDALRLVGPRVLARLPYGAASDAIESFPFEEHEEADAACAHVWVSGAFLVARAFAASIAAPGSPARAAEFSEIAGLPLHATRSGAAVGPAERLLRESELEQIARAGLLAVRGARGSDAVRIALDAAL